MSLAVCSIHRNRDICMQLSCEKELFLILVVKKYGYAKLKKEEIPVKIFY